MTTDIAQGRPDWHARRVATSKTRGEPADEASQALVDLGTDIEALAFLTLMDAAKSAQEDLKQIMAEVKAINRAKQALREVQCAIGRDVAAATKAAMEGDGIAFSPRGLGGEKAYHRVQLPVAAAGCGDVPLTAFVDLVDGQVVSVRQLDTALDAIKSRLDSLSELGEMESLRLQMAMDRLSKMMTTLSNVMKKISDTDQAITQNLK